MPFQCSGVFYDTFFSCTPFSMFSFFLGLQVQRDVGNVTVLINNAGIASGRKLLDTPDKMIDLTFKVNTIAHFWVST